VLRAFPDSLDGVRAGLVAVGILQRDAGGHARSERVIGAGRDAVIVLGVAADHLGVLDAEQPGAGRIVHADAIALDHHGEHAAIGEGGTTRCNTHGSRDPGKSG
jgi:hypothetical protein